MAPDQDNDPTQESPETAEAQSSIDGSPAASPLAGPLGLVVAFVLLGTATFLAYRTFYTAEPTPLDPPAVTYICTETRKTFSHKPRLGETTPIESPHSKKRTGYPAEKCYWTRDEKQLLIPTYILLNQHLGIDKPTICPDCERLVVPHNPAPPIGTPIAGAAVAKDPRPATTQPADG